MDPPGEPRKLRVDEKYHIKPRCRDTLAPQNWAGFRRTLVGLKLAQDEIIKLIILVSDEPLWD